MTKVFVSGVFNILHPGHLRLLRFARECGNALTVGVFSDRIAGNAAHIAENYRLEGIRSNVFVDDSFIIDEPLEDVLRRLKPDIVVKGREHEAHSNPEQAVLDEYGGRLLFSSGERMFSSIDVLRREFSELADASVRLPEDYMARHAITRAGLIDRLQGFSGQNVLVIGDSIVDEYITCDPLGMSQEDPTIVVSPVDKKLFVGGAGIVAAHAAGLGAQVQLLSVGGNDAMREYALEVLGNRKVEATLFIDESRPTTLKQRFRSRGKTLLRVNHLHEGSIPESIQTKILDTCRQLLPRTELLVFSDFNYGCLPTTLINSIARLAKEHRVMMVADSQSSSQVGDVGRFADMDLLTPTEHEARLAVRDKESGLVVLADKLKKYSKAKHLFLTLAEEGVLIHADEPSVVGGYETDRIAALNAAPRDVAGAGDSMLIVSSMALRAGADIWEASVLGSIAAAVQVGRVGNTPLNQMELVKEIQR